jgi:hypothetical protein
MLTGVRKCLTVWKRKRFKLIILADKEGFARFIIPYKAEIRLPNKNLLTYLASLNNIELIFHNENVLMERIR